MSAFLKIIKAFKGKSILVVGDVILDQYIEGSVTRISPEAPVPVVLEKKSFYTPGGAANVAHNLTALGAEVTLLGKVGKDLEGEILKRELKSKGISLEGIFVGADLPTISKTRILAQRQQVLRLDRERIDEAADGAAVRKIFAFIKKNITQYDAVIISDYGKGLISKDLVEFLCNCAYEQGVILTVDPKVENFGYYRNVTAITPNLNEAENAIRNIKIRHSEADSLAINSDRLDSDEQINLAGTELLRYLNLTSLLITLGERGMRLFEAGKKPYSIRTKAKEVFDVTGAGDAVISVFTLALSAGATKQQAAELANYAAGVVVGHMGAVAVTQDELKQSLKG